MSDYFATRERLRQLYIPKVTPIRGEALGGGPHESGFLTEVAGRVILTAPARTVSLASELPTELAERWEKASTGNPFYMWLQGRFVEAEKANRNGAFWSTDDLQFGEMSVKHGPLNWLHEEKTVIGTIADNALIRPQAQNLQQAASFDFNTTNKASLFAAQPRPFIAAVSAVWKWVHPEKVNDIERAADQGRLYYSMECIAREMSCVGDDTREGCGKSFDYVTAMTNPGKTCEHMQARSSARRMVDPSFLGGAVIVPPTQPGWGSANVEVMRQASKLAEQTAEAATDMTATQWETLMAEVIRYATV